MLGSVTNWAFKKKYYKDNVMLPYVSMTNESFIFLSRIMGLNGLIVE